MKLDIAEKWVAELRSGKYKKGKHRLQKNGNFCCLGVLCELAVKEGVIAPSLDGSYGSCRETHILPEEVQQWAGIKNAGGRFVAELPDGKTHSTKLYSINDIGHKDSTFPNIADIIEAYAEDL